MNATQQLTLPSERFRLEEINLPEDLAATLAGRIVAVEVLPEEPAMTRRLDLHNPPEGLPARKVSDWTTFPTDVRSSPFADVIPSASPLPGNLFSCGPSTGLKAHTVR